jgi:hypothetical protein
MNSLGFAYILFLFAPCLSQPWSIPPPLRTLSRSGLTPDLLSPGLAGGCSHPPIYRASQVPRKCVITSQDILRVKRFRERLARSLTGTVICRITRPAPFSSTNSSKTKKE